MKKLLKEIQFEVHLVDHCNLNCQMCDHFSPLAKESFLSPKSYELDIMRLGNVFNHQARYIRLLGGEPLLHPNISHIISITRTYFPYCSLELYTNGLLLLKQSKDFWHTCFECFVKIVVTKYPISFNYNSIEILAHKHNVQFVYTSEHGEPVKTSWRLPLDITGKQNSEKSFEKCDMGNVCVFLKNGRLYPCSVAPNAFHFNIFFNQHLIISDKDSISIYTADADEIFQFLAKPIPFCRYCDIDARQYNIPWQVSQKDISEWS